MSVLILKQPSQTMQVKQSGISLVELMVSMAVGLIISAGAAALFANTILSTRTLNSASQINEQGLQVTSNITRHLRMTGYVDWLSSTRIFGAMGNADNAPAFNLQSGQTITPFQIAFAAQLGQAANALPASLSGCDANYSTPASLNTTTCTTNTTATSALTVAYQVRSNPDTNSAPSVTNIFSNSVGMSGDCNNQDPGVWPLLSGGGGLFAVNRFYLRESPVSTALTGEPVLYDLMCQGNGGAAQPLSSNIEQFVVAYGIAQAGGVSNDLRVGSYLTAAEITTANAWGQVIAVRICLLVAGERNSSVNAGASGRNDCVGNAINFGNERRLRQVFMTTVSLRNQTHTAN
jgi:type IV pilus assembly protein PilW